MFFSVVMVIYTNCTDLLKKNSKVNDTSNRSNVENPTATTSAVVNVTETPTKEPDRFESAPENVQEINESRPTVGVRNFEQINTTMSAITGVPVSDNNIRRTYDVIKTQLPLNNNIKSFLASHQVAITRLGAEYCNRLIDLPDKRSVILPGVNFGSRASDSFSDEQITFMVTQFIKFFWPDVTSDDPLVNEAVQMSSDLVEILLEGESLSSSTTTRNVIKGVCTSLISSANTIIF